ncbi:MAG: glycosyl hydrolase [Pirellulaceae bacterium]
MYTETEGSRKAIGDVDVLYHEGLYHLFHLVLPNHDFIAHAVSTDGINWRRVANALFIGDPGSWDDLMLWTMHVTPCPHEAGRWRMFYTGLSRREQGRIQRLGLAVSDDLYHWRKAPVHWRDTRGPHDPERVRQARRLSEGRRANSRYAEFDKDSCFPLSADSRHYESSLAEGRHWVSFRDPYYYRQDGQGWLIASGRVKQGPVVRRGCVAVMEEVGPHHFESRPALHHPRLYDDIEVPNLIQLEDEYYLIGSIREDAKIRYWHTDQIGNPWRSYYDNVLMAKGNYAARVCRDDKGWLLWNFYSMNDHDRTTHNLMPPPKRLVRTSEGLLRAATFEGFDAWLEGRIDTRCIHALNEGLTEELCSAASDRLELQSEAGFQAFVFDEPLAGFRLQANLKLRGQGKCGLVFRVDPDTHDGYYLSLDLLKGVCQLRSWKTGPLGSGENAMQFKALQNGYWYTDTRGQAHVRMLAFGSYLELSIDGRVVLSLVDQAFDAGLLGVYLESSHVELSDVSLHRMCSPNQSDDHLASG